jgi:hypothetical protein
MKLETVTDKAGKAISVEREAGYIHNLLPGQAAR